MHIQQKFYVNGILLQNNINYKVKEHCLYLVLILLRHISQLLAFNIIVHDMRQRYTTLSANKIS